MLSRAAAGVPSMVHAIAGAGFGYPSGALGPLASTWRVAFGGMLEAVLADAARRTRAPWMR